MKLEDEQMLLNFGNVDELITWNLLLNVGKDVALDLTDREFPKYRTVPRRRRRNRNTEGNGSSSLSVPFIQMALLQDLDLFLILTSLEEDFLD